MHITQLTSRQESGALANTFVKATSLPKDRAPCGLR